MCLNIRHTDLKTVLLDMQFAHYHMHCTNASFSLDRFHLLDSGTRMCLGEQLAKMELFLLVANILQRYKISFPEEYKPKDDSEVFVTGALRMCGPYTANFTER